METEEIKFEYLKTSELKPYERNARKHKKVDVSAIKESIKEFGMNDPIGIWGDDNLIVEGHGRLQACTELGIDKVPVIRLDHMNDAQRQAYALAHNKTAELSDWDKDLLKMELEECWNTFDMDKFGFKLNLDGGLSDTYSVKVLIPQYEPTGEKPELSDLYDTTKSDALIDDIEAADIPEDVKDFLYDAAKRHTVFNYKNIAEYYAHAEPEVQKLFEDSALVIIDIDDAIAKGYCTLADEIKRLRENEE